MATIFFIRNSKKRKESFFKSERQNPQVEGGASRYLNRYHAILPHLAEHVAGLRSRRRLGQAELPLTFLLFPRGNED